jgi:PAS domain S-box-containing protein
MHLGLGPVLEAIADVVVVVDVAGAIIEANSATEEISGYRNDELVGSPVARLLVDERSGLRTAVRLRVGGGEVLRRDEAWLVTKSGDRLPVSLSAAPVTDEHGRTTGIVLVARDIRDLRELLTARDQEIARRESAEAELRTAKASIEQRLDQARGQLMLAERRATLGTLAAGVGHELRNIAQIHTSTLETITDHFTELGAPPEMHKALEDMERVGQHIVTHARRLLELAKPGPEHARALDLSHVIEDIVGMLHGAGKLRGIEIVPVLPEAPVMVTVNKARIEQILVNLVLNAAQAIGDETGKIMIAIHLDAPRKRVVVEISDTGPGIPATVLPRIFEPFFTTKTDSLGTGLGLPVAREIVESYGGALTVSSTPTIGTTFTFDLPMSSVR